MDWFEGFLKGLTDPIASGIGSEVSKAIFGRTDRLSNSDYQHMQNLADSGNPREIARQNQFLAGVTPQNAMSYNQYQDMTQPADTDRTIDRIQRTSTALGMSPWELTGTGGASPLPSPSMGPQQGTGQAKEFMAQMTPLAVAKLGQETALKTTAMNNATQEKIAGIQTGTQKDIAVYGQTGPEAQARIANAMSQLPINAQQVVNMQAQKILTTEQTNLAKDQQQQTQETTKGVTLENALKSFREIIKLLPSRTVKLDTPIGSVSTTGSAQGDAVARAIGALNATGYEGMDKIIQGLSQSLAPNDADLVLKALQDAAKGILEAGSKLIKDNPPKAKGTTFLENVW